MGNTDEGVVLFNEGRFFEAHDAWREQWLDTHDVHDKEFLQGLIAVAAAMHHYTRHDIPGFQKLLADGIAMLHKSSEARRILDCEPLLEALRTLQNDIITRKKHLSTQDFPHILYRTSGGPAGGE